MASTVVDEKAAMPTVPLTVHTATHSSDHHSAHDSETLTPTGEKNGLSIDMIRTSEASTPSSRNYANPFDTDIEAIVTSSSEQQLSRKSVRCSKRLTQDCEMWPGKDHWKRKAKDAKMRRSCNCLAHLSKRNRIIVKLLIGLLIIGIAVGVGVGISKPLGAGIWHPKDS